MSPGEANLYPTVKILQIWREMWQIFGAPPSSFNGP